MHKKDGRVDLIMTSSGDLEALIDRARQEQIDAQLDRRPPDIDELNRYADGLVQMGTIVLADTTGGYFFDTRQDKQFLIKANVDNGPTHIHRSGRFYGFRTIPLGDGPDDEGYQRSILGVYLMTAMTPDYSLVVPVEDTSLRGVEEDLKGMEVGGFERLAKLKGDPLGYLRVARDLVVRADKSDPDLQRLVHSYVTHAVYPPEMMNAFLTESIVYDPQIDRSDVDLIVTDAMSVLVDYREEVADGVVLAAKDITDAPEDYDDIDPEDKVFLSQGMLQRLDGHDKLTFVGGMLLIRSYERDPDIRWQVGGSDTLKVIGVSEGHELVVHSYAGPQQAFYSPATSISSFEIC